MSNSEVQIEQLIDEQLFQHYFQPIRQLSDLYTLGHEALMRSDHHYSPDQLFQAARSLGKMAHLDASSLDKAVRVFNSLLLSGKAAGNLFINLFPSTIVTSGFLKIMEQLSKNIAEKTKVVIEINEFKDESDFWTDRNFLHRIAELKKIGYHIAIDDVGEGAATLKNIVEMEPDFIKLDKYFSKSLSASKKKQELVQFFAKFCRNNNIQMILEGIETREDLTTAKEIGVSLGQGFYLGVPTDLNQYKI
ncbi:EAL domain-containing protein [Ferviditalea candida]|uniref:EAL domain-containing protein n=1 Tax=Ferviditalea candida TaxID=3108399 RepID=A0ABU5ZE18_9BACL|nr:EAL domain-containing protein [Paenibacillaceae bacterium T2]